MPITLLSALARLSAGALALQSGIPAVLPLKKALDDKATREAIVAKARAKANRPRAPMKGVPLMKVTPAVPPLVGVQPSTAIGRPTTTRLNEVGRADEPFTAAGRAAWRAELASAAAKIRGDWLRLWLAEADLAREYPQEAIARIDALLRTDPRADVRGIAGHDRAEALFYMGRYREARLAFESEMRGRGAGFDRREAALWTAHARACEGEHLANERLGVPLLLRIDPLGGAAALAVCLRGLGLPFGQKEMAKAVGHTGEGSSFADLAEACDRLGVAANPVRATEKGLRTLPLPAVARVEGDHLVAVVSFDTKGVEYVCSDCGAWPGGPVRVSWKAWRAMKPGDFMTVGRTGPPPRRS